MFSTLIYFTPPGGGAVSGQYWSAPSTVSGDGLSYLELTTPIQALASIPKSYVMRIGLYNETTGEEITQFVSPTLSAMGWDSLSTCSATVSLCVSRSSDGLLAHSYTIYAGYPTPLSPYTSRIDNLLVDDTSMYLPSVQISTDASISVSSGVSISSDVSISVSTGVVVDADTNISVLTGPTACSAVALYPAPQIRVSWSDIGSGASYQVQWKTSGGSYVDIATVPGSVGSSYVHLVDGSLTHRYRVRNSLSGYSTDWVESSYVSPYNGTKGKTKSVLAGNLNYGMNAGLD
jgi:hypothetical protein